MCIRKLTGFFLLFLILIMGMELFSQTDSSEMIQKTFSGIRPDDENGRNGLANPERGFRWENRIGSFDQKWQDEKWLDSIKNRCKPNGVTVTQAYCELIKYCDMERIPDEQIKRLEESFDAVRQNGIKLLLCFRYEMDVKDGKGPTLETILSHIEQLKPVLLKNMDIIAVFQTGFIGLYGEWHRSHHGLDKNPAAQEKVLRALLEILPPDRKLVIRYPRHKNIFVKRVSGRADLQPITLKQAHSMRPEARIGFANHGFMVALNDGATFAPRPSKEYDYMTEESLFLPMEGELFWASNRPHGVAKDDGLEAIQRLWEHHFTLFSYAHNHSIYEGWTWKEKFNARYSIDEWKEDEVNIEFLKENDLPHSVDYFKNAKGEYIPRSVFEYIRDHLGYRLELQSASYPKAIRRGGSFGVKMNLVNRGFAAPVNPRPVYLVLVGENQVSKIAVGKVDPRTWYPCLPENRKSLAPVHSLNFTGNLPPMQPGTYKLGLWLPDNYMSLQNDARYAIRFANRDVPWYPGEDNKYGINIVGSITVE